MALISIRIIPIGILFLIPGKILEAENMVSMMSRFGMYVLTVFMGLLIHGLIVLPALYYVCTRKTPFRILSKIGPAVIIAIGTSSR